MSDQDQAQTPEVNLFDSQDGQPQAQAEQQSTPQDQQGALEGTTSDAYKELLGAISNDDGSQKYKSVSDALVGASHAQSHIKRLETELEQARQNTQVTDVTKEIREALQAAGQPTQQQVQHQEQQPSDMEATLAALLEKRDSETKKQENQRVVNSAMAQKFGEKANEALVAKATELEVNPEFLKSLAETSPKAFLNYFDAKTTGTPSAPRSTIIPIPNSESSDLSPPENIMHGAKTKELVSFWREVGEQVKRDNT